MNIFVTNAVHLLGDTDVVVLQRSCVVDALLPVIASGNLTNPQYQARAWATIPVFLVQRSQQWQEMYGKVQNIAIARIDYFVVRYREFTNNKFLGNFNVIVKGH